MPSDAVWVALIVAVLGPFILDWRQGLRKSKERKEDIKRQDEVAQRLIAADTKTEGTLNIIHNLVNSSYTTQLEGFLHSEKERLLSLRDNVRLRRNTGEQPSKEVLSLINSIESSISDKELELVDRREKAAAMNSEGGE